MTTRADLGDELDEDDRDDQPGPGTPDDPGSGATGRLAVEYVPTADLRTFHRNPRRGDTAKIAESIRVNGIYKPIVVNRGTYTGRPSEVLAGNHTLMAARDLGHEQIAVVWRDVDDDQATRIVAADNRTSDVGDYDERLLAELLADLPDLDGTGYDPGDLDELERALADDDDPWDSGDESGDGGEGGGTGSLADRFLVPPMSVLDARRGWWQDRKRAWLQIGLRPETGRDGVRIGGWAEGGITGAGGKVIGAGDGDPADSGLKGLSIFDPVLCEIAYRWWCPPGGTVLDPFAGGSVRGVVAGYLGHPYHGVDLRGVQVDDNRAQAGLVPPDQPAPTWHVGDATALGDVEGLPMADLVFTCPPYADLERYSDDPRDLSTMPYDRFRDMHAKAIRLAAERLREDRFAVWVVGEARGPDGAFYGLVADTIHAAQQAGLGFATEATLVTMIGSGALRSARDFTRGRVLTRTHQNVLVFVKGDRRRAVDALGDVDITDALAEYEQRYEPGESAAAGEPDPDEVAGG